MTTPAADPQRLLPARPRPRDARVDVLRGAALLMIFVDHVPKNALNLLTLHNFGFCDAAELFVVLAGFSSMMAYGSKFESEGFSPTLRRIAGRCLRIYVAHVALLVLTVVVVVHWTEYFRMQPLAIAPLLDQGGPGLLRALTLRALPGYLDILPLYIVLLGAFPLIYLVMRRHVGLALGLSAAIWAAANIFPSLNLPNSIDGQGWYFNPFTWQLLFTAGAALAVLMGRQGDVLPRWRWLAVICWGYLGFALLQGGNWADWGLPSLRPLAMPPPEKSLLSPWRILDIAALLYLFLSSPSVQALLRNRAARLLAVCGKHSLEVFAVGCACALFGRLLSRTYGSGIWMQIGINVVGILAMGAVAMRLEHTRGKKSRAVAEPADEPQVAGFQEGGFGVYRAG